MSGPKFPINCADAAELEALLLSGALIGHAVHVLVQHDDKCSPSACRCAPTYVIEKLTADTWIAGAEAERAWRRGCAS